MVWHRLFTWFFIQLMPCSQRTLRSSPINQTRCHHGTFSHCFKRFYNACQLKDSVNVLFNTSNRFVNNQMYFHADISFSCNRALLSSLRTSLPHTLFLSLSLSLSLSLLPPLNNHLSIPLPLFFLCFFLSPFSLLRLFFYPSLFLYLSISSSILTLSRALLSPSVSFSLFTFAYIYFPSDWSSTSSF